ncbi:MAG TPA: hypothetical protein VMX95_05710 [Thermodesulfobacteriota bacterium]|nr:hypothetical protein [Thermodesulfobacteriota bacterium]
MVSQIDTNGQGSGTTPFMRFYDNQIYPANTCPPDNCPNVSNPDQSDTDGDGIGDACDTTVVKLSIFVATPQDGKVLLEWTTKTEINNAGFNLYRSESADGKYLKVNTSLIPAQGSAAREATYRFVDEDVKNRVTYYYKLEDIDIYGKSTMHGPVSMTPRRVNEWRVKE